MGLGEPRSYIGRGMDGVWEVDLKHQLESEPEEQRQEFLVNVLVLQEKARFGIGRWFRLADSVLESKASFERILRAGLGVADASSISAWLKVCAQRLGCRRLVRILYEEADSRPNRVALTLYHLPGLPRSPAERRAIEEFIAYMQSSRRPPT